ncbi:HtaA domain-containing protein [Streptomyces sp. KAU_LT]|uniref:HtaA domain-containing protein n=1 Tax=Streptomyces sp. KAU_LT TaxID=3046669 RepID=UPI0024B75C7C|nr:HtaA domain-containing protein [Streptomyces sp. KAU_LT]MDI9834428.1 HtaA domain-containing protein [Streptomyces sp. KAU_LT]
MPARPRRALALAAAVATTTALGATALAAASSASAAEVPLSGYELTWGIKQSYRTYVTTYAAGSFTPAGGASQAADNGAFTFPGGSGTYDSTAHTLDLGFQGSLTVASEAHGFEIVLSDVRFDSGDAEITADVTRDGTTTQDVPLADVTVTRAMTGMETRLTKEAADVLGSKSYEGAAGDPLTVVQRTESGTPGDTPSGTPTDVPGDTSSGSPGGTPGGSASPSASEPESPAPSASATGSASPSASPSPSATPTGSPDPSSSAPATQAPARGEIVDGTLGWGVKQSFRAYVVGPVADGTITATEGARQASGNGAFTFTRATGTYDTEAGTLSASFDGAVTFKGHEEDGKYGLDLTFSGLKVTLDGDSGRLTADVTSLGEKSEDVVLAELKAKSPALKADGDVITVAGIDATLSEAGAKAFGGFYTAGSALDPVNLSVALTPDAQLPGDGDGSGGSTGAGDGTGAAGGSSDGGYGTGGATTGGAGDTTGGISGGLASTGSDVPVAALGTAAAVTAAAGAGVFLAMRRRRLAE